MKRRRRVGGGSGGSGASEEAGEVGYEVKALLAALNGLEPGREAAVAQLRERVLGALRCGAPAPVT